MLHWPLVVSTLFSTPTLADLLPTSGTVQVELLEGIPAKQTWDFPVPNPSERYTEPAFGFLFVPKKYSPKAVVLDRSNPLVIRASGKVTFAAGEYRFLLRSHSAARLFIDDKLVLQTDFLRTRADGHEAVPTDLGLNEPGLRHLPVGHREKATTVRLDVGAHDFRVEAFIGGPGLRAELGELIVGVARPGDPFHLLGSTPPVPLSEEGWDRYVIANRVRASVRETMNRRAAGAEEAKYWERRHELARSEWQQRPAPVVPEVSKIHGTGAIDRFIGKKLDERKVTPAPLADDLTFLRRVTLDTVGVPPTRDEIAAFLADPGAERRSRAIDRLLADPRWADHWVGYWQDVLAENPGILKPMLNNTGPFRWYIHQAFRENLPIDRFVSELVMMEGSAMGGGPAGFGLATQNDAPMAEKAHVLAQAFLAIDLGCARCHDAPYHPHKQKELFSLAAMLEKKPITLPATSTVRVAEGARKPLVKIALKPGEKIDPAWPFEQLAGIDVPAMALREIDNPRERLAAALTSPRNERFPQVIVNRLWKRYLGLGIVEPVDDWHKAVPSHPELLDYLARELVTHDYDLKHVARLILNSNTYQRQVRPSETKATGPEDRLFAAPARRRLSAEQLIDSLFQVAGKEFRSEELTMDPEGRRPVTEMQNLGFPRRAWELTSLSNERDRPALALPAAQGIVDVLTTFGWHDSRQNPTTVRDETQTPVQPLVLANGVVGSRITRLTDESAITQLCIEDRSLPELIEAVYLQVLSRRPEPAERKLFEELLRDGYADRRVPGVPPESRGTKGHPTAVSWSNHLSPEATRIKLELERAVRAGDPPTKRLRADWRERMEDLLWSLVNSPEFVFVP